MSAIQISGGRPEASAIGLGTVINPSRGLGTFSRAIEDQLKQLTVPTPTFSGSRKQRVITLEERLYDALAAFKIRTSTIAMHLEAEWRSRLFSQLDSLLSSDSWEKDDIPPALESFGTFLRMLALLRPARRPGLGATTDGKLIATWTSGQDRLTIECLPKDLVRWYLSAHVNEEKESAAGITPLARLGEVLGPYGPQRWFADAHHVFAQ